MSDELGGQIQSMFRTIYEAVDHKYMRPIKVCASTTSSKIGCQNSMLTFPPLLPVETNVQMRP